MKLKDTKEMLEFLDKMELTVQEQINELLYQFEKESAEIKSKYDKPWCVTYGYDKGKTTQATFETYDECKEFARSTDGEYVIHNIPDTKIDKLRFELREKLQEHEYNLKCIQHTKKLAKR